MLIFLKISCSLMLQPILWLNFTYKNTIISLALCYRRVWFMSVLNIFSIKIVSNEINEIAFI